jgi:putative RNA 2'-phosphotransferase
VWPKQKKKSFLLFNVAKKGIYSFNVESIEELDLINQLAKKVKRHAVHLSHETLTATKVGSRRGDAIILEIDSKRMYADGIKFFKSENGVWLVDEVPSKYIKKL